MTGTPVDLATWDRAAQYHWFRGYERPHYAITTRIDASHLMRCKRPGFSVFRACLWAIGAGLHAVPALRMRFDRSGTVTLFDRLDLSPTIALESGDFRYTYIGWQPDAAAFDAEAAEKIAAVRQGQPLGANDTRQDVAYLSCVPWMDYTSLDNALPGADDCIPRVGWGKIVPKAGGHDMALTLQVHHALVDGRDCATCFAAVQTALDALSPQSN